MLSRYSVSRCCCAPAVATCGFCATGIGPQQWSFTITGAVPVYSTNFPFGNGITDNDLDAIVAAVNGTHSVNYTAPCTWTAVLQINGEFGDVYEVRLSLLLTNNHPAIFQPNVGMVLELIIDDVGEPPAINTTNTNWYYGTRSFWDKELSLGSTFDCTASQLLSFDSRGFDGTQDGRGYVDTLSLTSITVNPV